MRERALVQFVTGDIDGRRVAVEAPWTGVDDGEGDENIVDADEEDDDDDNDRQRI